MLDDLVRYSRAGDAFHYRWATRRCLNMIYPKSKVVKLFVEKSDTPDLDGELVIDVSEYLGDDENNINEIIVYQLKHTTVRKNKSFTLSNLKNTFEGFANRYRELFIRNKKTTHAISFWIITNRPISKTLKNNISDFINDIKIDSRTKKTLESYTRLKGVELKKFCKTLNFEDSEGDYEVQRFELGKELNYLNAGTTDNSDIANMIDLVQRKVMPNEDGEISKSEVLQCISGVDSESILFPAPPEYEKFQNVFIREQHSNLLESIVNSKKPIIIEAEGGVGKTVIANQLANSLPEGSLGVVYDCFGGGKYTIPSRTRHRHQEALVQISNEIAKYGLCAPLISGNAEKRQLLRHFNMRLIEAITILRNKNNNAILCIFIDAADNSVMAAEKFGDKSFAEDLLEEEYPDGCKIILLSRPERTKLLHPHEDIVKLSLEPFSEKETQIHLRNKYPDTNKRDAKEFHRLTNSGNPRVQSNALSYGNSFQEVLTHLGPTGQTVQSQIESLLSTAIQTIKGQRPTKYKTEVDTICVGLVTLPPFIPIEILAQTADVDVSTVKSFLSELGRPFLIIDDAVQFRDEPTETWFRKKFIASKAEIASYVEILKPLAESFVYVAESLPLLLLQAGKYDELINLALNDQYLPKNSPIDKRNIRVYRLKFAFKAALKNRNYNDAIKLAMLSGEELAGDKRQLELLQNNIDLIEPLQSEQRVQELAFRGMFSSEWRGSKDLYSASLFSTVKKFEGETRSYLRAAYNWIYLHFEKRKSDNDEYHVFNLEDDFVEFAFTHFNLDGITATINFLIRVQSNKTIFQVTRKFVKRLIDARKYDSVNEMLQVNLNNQHIVFAIIQESFDAGYILASKEIDKVLTQLTNKKLKEVLQRDLDGDITLSTIISFLEVCAANKKSKTKIIHVLKKYSSFRANKLFTGELYEKNERQNYLRSIALITVLENKRQPEINYLLPKEYASENKRKHVDDYKLKQFTEVINSLLPWYILRTQTIVGNVNKLTKELREVHKKTNEELVYTSRENDVLQHEVSSILVDILSFSKKTSSKEIKLCYQKYFAKNRGIWIQDHFKLLSNSSRHKHLAEIRSQEEIVTREIIESSKEVDPETRANWYIEIARAILPNDKNDSAIYFNCAIEAVSKFGNEIVQRWNAVSKLAERASKSKSTLHQLAYRYIRCAEQVGESTGREKDWNRNRAIEICTKLSPPVSLSSLSRWRDRNVGRFNDQIYYIGTELVKNNFVATSVGWALTPFYTEYGLDDFAILCLEKASSQKERNHIFNSSIHQLQLNEASHENWVKLNDIAEKYSLENKKLSDIVKFYQKHAKLTSLENNSNYEYKFTKKKLTKLPNWSAIFNKIDITVEDGIVESIKRFNEFPDNYMHRNDFWKELSNRLSEEDALKFVKSLILSAEIDDYDINKALLNIPKHWQQKVSFQHRLPKIFNALAQRFFLDFSIKQYSGLFFADLVNSDKYSSEIQEGIVEGFINNSENLDESSYFRFIEIASDWVSPIQSTKLLDFALKRFEIHIAKDVGDGEWSKWLKPPDNICDSYTGLIWSALGSPVAKVRWQAMHSVRKLCEMNCEKEIAALVKWMGKNTVDAFGNKEFPFYNLHSRLYLLIAFARVSIEFPKTLKVHSKTFSKIALNDIPHLLMQKFSSEIALNIERKFSKTYNTQTIEKLKKVGASQLPIKNEEEIKIKQHNPFDDGGEFRERKFNTGYDIPKYWFNSLSRIFDISIREIDDLVVNIIVDEWKIKTDGGYRSDPRHHLWRYDHNEFNTHHSHGAYPSVDDFNFYLSYHAMFVVAYRLLKKQPIVEDDYYSLVEWIQRHSLTRKDGRWLADRRDPAPLWGNDFDKRTELDNWITQVDDADFLGSLLLEKNNEIWFRVFGEWTEGDEYTWNERIVISSALVPTGYSQSLLNAISTYKSPYDFYLPYYKEDEEEINSLPFELRGWIKYNHTDHNLDRYDPFANEIKYNGLEIGKEICEKLGLKSDYEKRNWYTYDRKDAVITSKTWSTNHASYNIGPLRDGNCISISLNFLKKLCSEYDSDLIIEVQIDRTKKNSRSGISHEYKPPKNKIFIFSKDGKIRDTEKNYKIGQTISKRA